VKKETKLIKKRKNLAETQVKTKRQHGWLCGSLDDTNQRIGKHYLGIVRLESWNQEHAFYLIKWNQALISPSSETKNFPQWEMRYFPKVNYNNG
jgi:hypothetical protein